MKAGGIASVAAIAGARVLRLRSRHQHRDFSAGEDRLIDADRPSAVTAEDGVRLAVRESGPRDAPLTAILVHGFSNRMTSFHLRRRLLAQRWGRDVRMVFFDLRGHGKSGTPEQLGVDLASVIRAVSPRGPSSLAIRW